MRLACDILTLSARNKPLGKEAEMKMASKGYKVYIIGTNGDWIYWSHEVCYADAIAEANWQRKTLKNAQDVVVVED